MKIFKDAHQNETQLPHGEEIKWRISAYVLVINDKKEVLLVKPKFNPDLFILPGGGMEIDETIKEGIERECYEETGYKIEVDVSHPIYCGESPFYDDMNVKKPIFYHSIILIYEGSLLSSQQDTYMFDHENEEEVESVHWIPLAEINEKNCHTIMYPAIEKLKLKLS